MKVLKKSKFKKFNENRFNSEFDLIYNYFGNKELNILDFGAGWGSWLQNINNSKVKLFAFEVSPSREKYLEKIKNIKLLNQIELNEYSKFFDFIRLEQVLEHLTELQSNLELLKKIIKPGGIISVGVPDGKNVLKI